jgi:penicillin-binding protein 1C
VPQAAGAASRWLHALPWLAIAAAVLIASGAAALRALAPPLPDFASLRAGYVASDARLLDRHGRLLHERRVDAQARRLRWMPLADVAPALPHLLVAVEDRRFASHRGVDVRALAAAAVATLRGGRRGGSTLTMQLAARIDPSLAPARGSRTPAQKLRQVAAALALERRYTKAQVLEAYLNLMTFRGELVGIDAAARGLFGKAPHALDVLDASLLVALLRAPNAAPTRVAATACALAASPVVQAAVRRTAVAAATLRRPGTGEDAGSTVAGADAAVGAMRHADADAGAAIAMAPRGSDCTLLAARAQAALSGPPLLAPPVALAPHVATRLLHAPGVVRTTLDAGVQRAATQALAARLAALAGRHVRDGAVLAVDNESGDVLAWVGSSGARSASPYVDFVRAPRQAGSTLKPFVYALAFERRLLTPESLLADTPLDVATPTGSYRPDNYDHAFRGAVPARVALASSLNVPAVRVLERAGVDAAVVALRALGVHGLRRADHYGPALALGAADVSLLELVTAYRALARGGVAGGLRVVAGEAVSPPLRVLSEGASFLVGEILADRGNRGATFGLESALATRFHSAVKTGTSKDMRDNWCIGYTRRFTVGAWVGNGNGEPMHDVSGVDGAATVWREVMDHLHEADAGPPPLPPADVVRAGAGHVLRGTEAALAAAGGAPVDPASLARIVAPADGTFIAVDADIPASRQRVVLEAEPASADLELALDGRALGSAAQPHLWSPARGRHEVTLRDARGRVLDRVDFVVR